MNFPAKQNELSQPNLIKQLVHDYNQAFEAIDRLHAAARDLDSHTKRCAEYVDYDRNVRMYAMTGKDMADNWKAKLLAASWGNVLKTTKTLDRLSTSERDKYERKFRDYQGQPFTVDNIIDLIGIVAYKYDEVHMKSVLDAFDYMTLNARNRDGAKGYATNDAYQVRKKVILQGSYGMTSYGWGRIHRGENRLDDIDRALAYLTGKNFEEVTTINKAVKQWVKTDVSLPDCQSTFFRIKPYQNGNLHVYFLDTDLCDLLNRAVAKERNWLKAA